MLRFFFALQQHLSVVGLWQVEPLVTFTSGATGQLVWMVTPHQQQQKKRRKGMIDPMRSNTQKGPHPSREQEHQVPARPRARSPRTPPTGEAFRTIWMSRISAIFCTVCNCSVSRLLRHLHHGRGFDVHSSIQESLQSWCRDTRGMCGFGQNGLADLSHLPPLKSLRALYRLDFRNLDDFLQSLQLWDLVSQRERFGKKPVCLPLFFDVSCRCHIHLVVFDPGAVIVHDRSV